MEIQYSVKNTISYTVHFTFLPNKAHSKVLYTHMYDHTKDKITTVISTSYKQCIKYNIFLASKNQNPTLHNRSVANKI